MATQSETTVTWYCIPKHQREIVLVQVFKETETAIHVQVKGSLRRVLLKKGDPSGDYYPTLLCARTQLKALLEEDLLDFKAAIQEATKAHDRAKEALEVTTKALADLEKL